MNGIKNGRRESDGQIGTGSGLFSTSSDGGSRLQWKLGLVNCRGRYLTAETFGFKINATGTTLRKKQLWTLEWRPGDDDSIYLRSHLGRYLAGDRRGSATCCSEEPEDAERFVLELHADGSGRWAVRNRTTGFYLGGNDELPICHDKQPGSDDWWTPHFAFPPQINIRSVNRQKYASLYLSNDTATNSTVIHANQLQQLGGDSDNVRISTLIPWGWRCLFSLEYVDGRYAVRTNDDRYVQSDGTLSATRPSNADGTFSLELKLGTAGSAVAGLALRGLDGRYLTAVGRDAVLQTRNSSVGKDEMFMVEEGRPQVIIVAHNGKMVSIRQGVDPSANQDVDEADDNDDDSTSAVTDRETFQLEYNVDAEQWRVRTADNLYWVVESNSGIQANGPATGERGLFSIDWLEDGRATIRAACSGRYVTARLNGSLQATVDASSQPGDRELFTFTLVNRPRLVLKCEHGFVGVKAGAASPSRVDCSRSSIDVVSLISVRHHRRTSSADVDCLPPAAYFLRGSNDRYWTVDSGDGSVLVSSEKPRPFIVELYRRSRLTIRDAATGVYITGEQNGSVYAKYSDVDRATLWEY